MINNQTVTKVLDILSQEVLETQERRLLSMALAPSATQEELDSFLQGWDIEQAPIHSVILLAGLMKAHPELSFPDSVLPRLKGVLTYCRFQSLKLYAHFAKIATGLKDHQIPFVLLKGGAMKALRPELPRWMGDIDILVKEQDFHEAEKMASGMGYSPFRCSHSSDLRINGTQESVVDLHRFIQMNTGKETDFNASLFSRSSSGRLMSTECLIPCPEDMAFISLVNLYRNLCDKTSTGSVLNTFTDLHYLLARQGFSWEILKENARVTGTEIQLRLAAAFVSNLLPDAFPEDFLADWAERKEAVRHCIDLMYQREIISPRRAEIGEFNLHKALKDGRNLGGYVKQRAVFFFLKRVPGIAARTRILQKNGIVIK